MKLENISASYHFHRKKFSSSGYQKMEEKAKESPIQYRDLTRTVRKIKMLTPLVKGTRVLRSAVVPPATPYVFGQTNEDIGEILDVVAMGNETRLSGNKPISIAIVRYDDYGRTEEHLGALVAYDDYLNWLKENGKPIEVPAPKYRIDQILYVKPNPDISPNEGYPAIGSKFELDVKVVEVRQSKLGSSTLYTVIVPGYGNIKLYEELLLTREEKDIFKYKDFKFMIINRDLKPFFSNGEKVKIFEDHVYNMSESVVIRLNDELKQYLQ